MEVLVGKFAWYAKVIAHGARTDGLPAHSTRDSPQWRSSKLATTRILVSKLSCFLLPTHHPQLSHCAHIVTAGSIGANDLKRQGQRYLAQCLRQWKYRTKVDGCSDGLGFLTSLYLSDFPSLISVIILMYLFGFEKLAIA